MFYLIKLSSDVRIFITPGLREVRSEISDGCTTRIIFYINGNEMILLHGFIKKTQKTPKNEIDLAVKRKKEHEKHE